MSNEEAIRELLKANGIRHFIIETKDYGNIDVVEYKEYLKLKKALDKIKERVNKVDFDMGDFPELELAGDILELLEEIE